jgi:hypothetical protein
LAGGIRCPIPPYALDNLRASGAAFLSPFQEVPGVHPEHHDVDQQEAPQAVYEHDHPPGDLAHQSEERACEVLVAISERGTDGQHGRRYLQKDGEHGGAADQ